MQLNKAFLWLALLFPLSAHAELRLASLFSDGAVLQRDKPVAVWGWADAGEKVSVSIRGKSAEATANSDGRWQATLPAMPASSESAELTVTAGGKSVTVHDVLVGEVWMCSGQSNMEWHVKE